MSELTHQQACRLIYRKELSAAERQALQAHLRVCEGCRQFARTVDILNQHLLLDTLPARPSRQFTAEFMESAARHSRRSQIMKPIYAVGGLAALLLLMLAGWFIVRSNLQTTGLLEAPQLPSISLSGAKATPQLSAAESKPDVVGSESDMAMLDERLFAAVGAGDASLIAELLETGANANAIDSRGKTPLAVAVGVGQHEIAQRLLDGGAEVNATYSAGAADESAIYRAAENDDIEMVRLLIAYGADVNLTETSHSQTALHAAAYRNQAEIVRLLLENGADPEIADTWFGGYAPLHTAASRGSFEVAEALLDSGVDVNVLTTHSGETPLMVVDLNVGNSDLTKMATLLLERGGDPNMQDAQGNTPLHHAVMDSEFVTIPLLIAYGASVDRQNVEGNTPLHLAVKLNRGGSVRILLEQGASTDIENGVGQTALDLAQTDLIAEMVREAGATTGSQAGASAFDDQLVAAVEAGDAAAVASLLEAGANPNTPDARGNALLALAARDGLSDIVQQLLEAGANANGTLSDGRLALIQAAYNNHIEVVRLLIEYGADVNLAQGRMEDTALLSAAVMNNAEIVSILLENGADPNIKTGDAGAFTPLIRALQTDSIEAVQALLDGGADPDLATAFGVTPLMTAIASTAPVDLLLAGGADPDLQDGLGDTALHYAARESNLGAVELLIEQGASVDVQNNEGQTALDLAGNDAIADLLRQAAAAE